MPKSKKGAGKSPDPPTATADKAGTARRPWWALLAVAAALAAGAWRAPGYIDFVPRRGIDADQNAFLEILKGFVPAACWAIGGAFAGVFRHGGLKAARPTMRRWLALAFLAGVILLIVLREAYGPNRNS